VGFRLFLDDTTQRKRTWSLTLAARDTKGIGFLPGPEPTKLLQQWPQVADAVLARMREYVEVSPRAGWWRNENEPGFVTKTRGGGAP
jgi:hypothetical protein